MKQLKAIGLIAILGVIAYVNCLSNEFVFDDESLIVKNPYVKSWHFIPQLFKTDIFEGGNLESNFYRPIQMLSYMFDHALGKLNPFGYHLTNMLIHIFNAILVYSLINLLTKEKFISLAASLFFLIHPLQTEAVTYISGRSDLLGTLFLLISLISYVRYSSSLKAKALVISLISFLLVLLSREAAIIFPLILVLYNLCFANKQNRYKFIYIYFLISGLYILLRLTLLKFPTTGPDLSNLSLSIRLLTSLKVFGSYLRLLFLPFGLHMEREVIISRSLLEPQVIISLFLFSFFLIVIFKSYKRDKLITFGLGWFLLNLIPYLNIYPLNAFMAEHWLYLPSIGFFMAVTHSINRFVKLKKMLIVFAILFIAFYSALTIRRNLDWKDSLTFYQKALKYAPNSFKVHTNLGYTFSKKGKLDEAMEEYKIALRLNPKSFEAHNNLGNIFAKKGMFDEAIMEYKEALRINSNAQYTYFNLGNTYMNKRMYREAVEVYEKAVELIPQDAEVRGNLGLAYYLIEDYRNAKTQWEIALKLDPSRKNVKEGLEQLRRRGF